MLKTDKNYKKVFFGAFTLAEVMITLTVIGIIAAVIIPVAIHSTPDESVLKFKKGHDTLYKIISTLVNSDEYYLDGDLGIKPDGTYVLGSKNPSAKDFTTGDDDTYLCTTMADIISTKSLACSNSCSGGGGSYVASLSNLNEYADNFCINSASTIGAEIVTTDGITYYQTCPSVTFGIGNGEWYELDNTRFGDDDASTVKFFCMDIDGIDNGEDPFGYSIRVDGKIYPGARALEWLNKSIQGDE